jgi:iron complex outermembrane receptor protein
MNVFSRAPLAVLACALAAPPARAQAPSASPAPSPDPAIPRLEEVVDVEGELPAIPPAAVTTFRLATPVQSVPASVSVVPRSVLDSQDAFVLGDALRNVSGVSVGTGFGVFDFFTIRGFDSLGSALVLTDGVFEPESAFYPLYNVRQVEVVKGPAAFLYGANPLSGAVHLVRKQPMAGRSGTASVSYGSFDTYEVAGDGNLSSSDGRLGFRLNGVYRDSDGYRDGRESSICAANPVLSWRPDDRTRVTFNLEGVWSRMTPDTGLPVVGNAVADVPRTRSYQTPLDRSDQDIYRARVDVERATSGALRLRAKAYYTDFDWRSDGTLLVGVFPAPPAGLLVGRTLLMLDDRQTVLGTQLEALWSGRALGAGHEMLAGLEVARLGDRFTLDVGLPPPIGLREPLETTGPSVDVLPGASQRGDARSVVIAPYVVDRIRLGDRVQAVLGARFDLLDYEEPLLGTERSHRQLSPMAGLTFSPRPSLTAYAQAGAAFGPPSSLVVGEREPERSRQVEAGVKAQWLDGRAFATVAAYHLERDDIAIPDSTGVTRQNGDQRSRGIEVELSAEPTPSVFAYASYAFTSAKLTRFAEIVPSPIDPTFFEVVDWSGNVPAFAPRHLFSLWTVKRAGPVSVGVGGRYVGRQFIAEDNAFAVDAHLVLDAMASYRFRRATLSVNARNLTGREYETRGFGRTAVIPADPFAVYATLTVSRGR